MGLRLALLIALAAALALPERDLAVVPQAEHEQLTPSTLPHFLAEYEARLESVDAAFQSLEGANLPLLDESGRPLERRSIKDRHRTVSDLRDTVKRLGAKPQNLVLALTFFDRSEKLADDLYDLSQIAYDNDQEELGGRLTELVTTEDHYQDLIESYALDLAAKKEEQLSKLESEKRDLEAKLKGAAEAAKSKSAAPK